MQEEFGVDTDGFIDLTLDCRREVEESAALFDVLVCHTDRSHNWGAVPGHGRKRLKLIDHGYAFRQWPGRPFSSSFASARDGDQTRGKRSTPGFALGAERHDLRVAADRLEHAARDRGRAGVGSAPIQRVELPVEQDGAPHRLIHRRHVEQQHFR
jgi:hypothetical protein